MFHTIIFHNDATIDLEISPKLPLERMSIRRGTRLSAEIRPHVVENPDGLFEVADLFFPDGTATRLVAYEQFEFVD